MDIKYVDNDYKFSYRVSSVILNKNRDKVLLFNVEGNNYYLLPGGKVNKKEKSIDAIKREIKEEIGFENIDYSLLAISEELVMNKEIFNHQINLIYLGIYKDDINEIDFKGLEGEWINFKWVDINKLDNYEIFPTAIKNAIKDPSKIYHFIES